MLKKRFDFLVATVFLGLLPIDAHAYLDPGTGSMLLSVVMGLVSTGYFVTLKSSKAPTNYFTPNILRKSWSRLVVSVVHLDALAFPVAAT